MRQIKLYAFEVLTYCMAKKLIKHMNIDRPPCICISPLQITAQSLIDKSYPA